MHPVKYLWIIRGFFSKLTFKHFGNMSYMGKRYRATHSPAVICLRTGQTAAVGRRRGKARYGVCNSHLQPHAASHARPRCGGGLDCADEPTLSAHQRPHSHFARRDFRNCRRRPHRHQRGIVGQRHHISALPQSSV